MIAETIQIEIKRNVECSRIENLIVTNIKKKCRILLVSFFNPFYIQFHDYSLWRRGIKLLKRQFLPT